MNQANRDHWQTALIKIRHPSDQIYRQNQDFENRHIRAIDQYREAKGWRSAVLRAELRVDIETRLEQTQRILEQAGPSKPSAETTRHAEVLGRLLESVLEQESESLGS